MKHPSILWILLFSSGSILAQEKWFTVYSDSVSLSQDANRITIEFVQDVKKVGEGAQLNLKTVVNTTPYTNYYQYETVNISLWHETEQQMKEFLTFVTGSEGEGKKMFGLFFNGFYLPHELAHGLQDFTEGKLPGSYEGEKFANQLALLWWKKKGRHDELRACYELAKKAMAHIPNPVPEGETAEAFFTANYREILRNFDPLVYAYMQWSQYISIYEDQTLPDFDLFLQHYFDARPPANAAELYSILVEDQLNAYRLRDIDALLEFYADDIKVYEHPFKLVWDGKEVMRQDYASFFKNGPPFYREVTNKIIQGNIVIHKERVLSGESRILESTTIYEIENNKIKTIYYLD